PFRWDPVPVNRHGQGTITYTPSNPKVGEFVTFTIKFVDPDAPFTDNSTIAYGEGPEFAESGPEITCKKQYGPWTPPPGQPGSEDRYTRYAYKAPGTYTVKWTLRSRTDYPGCEDPYGEVVPATATVTVAPG